MAVESSVVQLLVSLSVASAVGYLYLAFSTQTGKASAQSARILEGQPRRSGLFLRIFGPMVFGLGAIIRTLPIQTTRQRLFRKLQQAGRPGSLDADEFISCRIVAAGLGMGVGLFFDSELEFFPMGTLCFLLLGFVYPDVWLSDAIQKRRRKIFRDLPDLLDMLRLAVSAGMDLSSALKIVVDRGKRGPLLDELEFVERELSLGRTRKEAFRNFAERLQMTEVNAFVIALLQADQLGASIEPILKVQSETARTKRWQLAEALVNKMPVKMMGPLVLFIFPASFIVLFTPLVIQYMESN